MIRSYWTAPMQEIAPIKVSSEHIEIALDRICDYYGFTIEQLKGKSRLKNIVQARQMACYILRRKMNLPLQTVGDLLNRHHATIIYSASIVEDYIEFEEPLRRNAAYLTSRCVPLSEIKTSKHTQLIINKYN